MKHLSILLISLALFGCAQIQPKPQVIEKEVFVKCPIPDIPKTERPRIKPETPYPEKLQCLLNYIFQLEKERDMLREVLEACKNEN